MATEPEIITDARGRKLAVRDLTALEDMRLLRAIGPYQSDNRPYVENVQMASAVRSIDGQQVLRVTNERQIDALIDRLGDDAMAVLQVRRVIKLKALYAQAEAVAAQMEADNADKEADGEEVDAPNPLTESASS